MSLETRNARPADHRVVICLRPEFKAVAFGEIDRLRRARQTEADRTALHHDDLVVGVSVHAVLRTGPVRPAVRRQSLLPETALEIVAHR